MADLAVGRFCNKKGLEPFYWSVGPDFGIN
jgi:hypothetical protein